MSATSGRDFSGQEYTLEFTLGEWSPEAHTSSSARKTQVVRLAAIGNRIDSQRQIQLGQ